MTALHGAPLFNYLTRTTADDLIINQEVIDAFDYYIPKIKRLDCTAHNYQQTLEGCTYIDSKWDLTFMENLEMLHVRRVVPEAWPIQPDDKLFIILEFEDTRSVHCYEIKETQPKDIGGSADTARSYHLVPTTFEATLAPISDRATWDDIENNAWTQKSKSQLTIQCKRIEEIVFYGTQDDVVGRFHSGELSSNNAGGDITIV